MKQGFRSVGGVLGVFYKETIGLWGPPVVAQCPFQLKHNKHTKRLAARIVIWYRPQKWPFWDEKWLMSDRCRNMS